LTAATPAGVDRLALVARLGVGVDDIDVEFPLDPAAARSS
jgi:phosphoglycerate dehydrogenase-like enzyme